MSEAELITLRRPTHRSLPEWLLRYPISSRASVRYQSAQGGGEEPPGKLGCGAAPPQCAKPYSRRLWGQASGVRAAGRRAAGLLRSAGSPVSVRRRAAWSSWAGALFRSPSLMLALEEPFPRLSSLTRLVLASRELHMASRPGLGLASGSFAEERDVCPSIGERSVCWSSICRVTRKGSKEGLCTAG